MNRMEINNMKAPMTFYEFKKHIDTIKQDVDYIDKCYDVGFDLYDKINTIYYYPELLSDIFKDSNDLIYFWLFENSLCPIKAEEELYDMLVKGYNAWLKEECSPEK